MMKTVVRSRFLCYLTIINAKFEDDEHHYKCHYELSYNQYVFTRNAKIGKYPLFSTLRFVKQMFSF